MEFLYATDLHGSTKKYEDVFNCAINRNVKLIHLGADLLPKGSGILEQQKRFVKGFLKQYYEQAQSKGIKILAHFGNDDLYTRKKYFTYATLLDEIPVEYEGYKFIAYGFVPDYPFGLKTACKLDSLGWWCPDRYISSPVDVSSQGFYDIIDVEKYFADKGTIEEDLAKIYAEPITIASIHCPPSKLGLDVCTGNRCVGSDAVLKWIEKEQPLLVLCGHIHESPSQSKVWNNWVNKTLVVQPGQTDSQSASTSIVSVVVDNGKVSVSMI